MDAFSRKIVVWSINNNQSSNLVINAIEMAISDRDRKPDTVFRSDHGGAVHVLEVHQLALTGGMFGDVHIPTASLIWVPIDQILAENLDLRVLAGLPPRYPAQPWLDHRSRPNGP